MYNDYMDEQERTKEKKAEFLKHLAEAKGLITSAVLKTGIHRSTYYDWIDNDPKFYEDCKKVDREQRDFVHDRFLGKIMNDDTACMIFYLKNKHPDYKQKIEISGELDTRAKFNKMSDEELVAALESARNMQKDNDSVNGESETNSN